MTDPPTWPFPDPEDAEAIILDRIVAGEAPIRLVTRDEDEPSWQFLDGDHVFEEDGLIVRLGEAVQLDPALIEVADLPIGGYAWRAGPGSPWRRGQGEPPAVLPD